MLTDRLALKYAQAVYELAVEKNLLTETETQLKSVEAAIAAYADLATLIYHPRVPSKVKKETIEKLFKAELTDFVFKFLLLLVDKRRETALPAVIREYVKLANAVRNIAEAEVITAMPLSDGEQQALAAKLSRLTGKTMLLKTSLDQSIIGGVIVKIGDKLIDGSVTRRLRALQASLQVLGATKIGKETKIGVTN